MDSAAEKALLVITLFVAIGSYRVIYRLYFHPLSHYPGPTVAALTDWYVLYYDLIKDGQMVSQLQKLHEQYGPVVRYGPNKLHFSDPTAFEDIYRSPTFSKDKTFYNGFVLNEASFGMTGIQQAKERRHILLPFFSRRSVLKLEHIIQQTIERFFTVLSTKETPYHITNLRHAYSCISLEVITEYCFAKRLGAIEHPDFHHPVVLSIEGVSPVSIFLIHLPFLIPLVFGLPGWITKVLFPTGRALVEFREEQAEQIEDILRDPTALDRAEHEIIYHHLLNPKSGSPLGRDVLQQEAATLIGAGTETVGGTLTVTTYHILADLEVKKTLIKELEDAFPDPSTPMSLEKLEKLPYLTGCIYEGLRISNGVVTPMPREVNAPSVIAGYPVPENTVVSMSHTYVHSNESVFPNAKKFDPQRWVKSDISNMEGNIVTFSKGPRMCIGMNLAWAELYLILGNLFRRVDLELINTTEKDMEWKALFLPMYRGTLQVMINGVEN